MLKALLLRKKIDDKKKALAGLESEDFSAREAELAAAIDEIPEDATEEMRSEVESMVDEFEAVKAEAAEKKAAILREIEELENELAAIEDEPQEEKREIRRVEMMTRTKMNFPEGFITRDDVKEYLGEIRTCIKEKRALTNVGLTIPEVFLGVLRERIEEYSKLYKYVSVRPVGGDGRAVIMGTIPEAVWTDCCANLNELDLGFNDVEVNCWRVGGYFPVCNANLEDSDIDLAAELVTALGQAIGIALDRAILYGTGTRMPLGVVTRLAQTSQPDSYPATARAWVDLHATNIKSSISQTGINLFTTLITNMGAAKNKYAAGGLVHVMNQTTYTYLMAQAASINAAGAVVSGIGQTMPIIGGDIVVLDLVPDYNIVSGYFDLYLLAERAGQKFASSEHVKFLADQTVFKGTARYDGQPAIAEAFVVQAINSQSASSASSFPDDDANSVQSIALNTSTAAISGTGTYQLIAITAPGSGTVEWKSATTSKATVNDDGLVTGVTAGTSVITATCNGLTATCTVTVS